MMIIKEYVIFIQIRRQLYHLIILRRWTIFIQIWRTIVLKEWKIFIQIWKSLNHLIVNHFIHFEHFNHFSQRFQQRLENYSHHLERKNRYLNQSDHWTLNQSNRSLNQSDCWSTHRTINWSIHWLNQMSQVVIQKMTYLKLKFIHLN